MPDSNPPDNCTSLPEVIPTSVAEQHHFDAAPAPAPSLLYSREKFLKGIKVNIRSDILFSFYSV
jgi:hypothetical protein